MCRYRRIEWALRGVVALALAALVGCKQELFLHKGDYQQAVTAGMPAYLEDNPHGAINPPHVVPLGMSPAHVLSPDRTPRPVTLRECVAVAVEQGNTGIQSPQQFGVNNSLTTTINGATGPDAIRAFALDPASSAASIERALSRFDTRWVTQLTWSKIDSPVAAQFLSFQQQRDAAVMTSRFDKPLPSGGLASITFETDYSKFSTIPASQVGSFVNPNYTPVVTFAFQQPLLRQFGVEINQMNDAHPGDGSQTNFNFPVGASPFNTNLPGQSSILVTRIRRDQAQVTFEQQVNFLLVNVETAYWNLYGSYYNLYAQEEGFRQAYDGYRFTKARVDAGTDPQQNLFQGRAQLEQFRSQVYTARGQVLESERQLRGFMGLRSDDGYRLVPVDEPNLAPYVPDFYEAANEAMAFKPELMILRQEVKIAQLQLRLTRNLRQPDLRLITNYNVAGLGTRLDGSPTIFNTTTGTTIPGNALTSFGNNQFNTWNVGLRLDVPIGFRDTNAQVRQATLLTTRNYIMLRDAEMKALEYLAFQYRNVILAHTVIGPLTERRKALQNFLYLFRIRIETGSYQPTEYLNYLTNQQNLATAIQQEFKAIADYNSALAQFEWSKGTILRYNNIHLHEGPLPAAVAQRARDHEKARSAAIKLRERPAMNTAPQSPTHIVSPAVGTPVLPPIAEMPMGPVPELDGNPKGPKKLPTPHKLPGPIAGSMGEPAAPMKPMMPDVILNVPGGPGAISAPAPTVERPLPTNASTGSFALPGSGVPAESTTVPQFTPTGETVTPTRFGPAKNRPRETATPSVPSDPLLPPVMAPAAPAIPAATSKSGIPASLPN
ncbi:MAG TPA: TolC family protein [Urbifossiella sp.]|nr:TolC family protein [Urbifossiella sp.]